MRRSALRSLGFFSGDQEEDRHARRLSKTRAADAWLFEILIGDEAHGGAAYAIIPPLAAREAASVSEQQGGSSCIIPRGSNESRSPSSPQGGGKEKAIP